MKNIFRQIRTLLQIIYHILRYDNKVKIKYNLKKIPNFENNKSNNFFTRELKKSKFYFEYGSGSSTIYANRLLKKYISIDSDKNFYLFMKSKNIPNIKFINFRYVFFFQYLFFINLIKKNLFKWRLIMQIKFLE